MTTSSTQYLNKLREEYPDGKFPENELYVYTQIRIKELEEKHYIISRFVLNGKDTFDISNKNLTYVDMSPTHHGMQCCHSGGTEEYKKIMELCDGIVERIKEIEKIQYAKVA